MIPSVRTFVVAIIAVGLVAWAQHAIAQPHAAGDAAPSGDGTGAPAGADALAKITGKVLETMDSGGYTYVQVDDGTKKVWAAGPLTPVAVGKTVTLEGGMAMQDFHSKTLDRTFDVIYFVGSIQVAGAAAMPDMKDMKDQIAAAHGAAGHGGGAAPPTSIDLSDIKKADGGQTVAELFANKGKLAGKPVAVRGRVVKVTSQVMGKNWIHVRDGSGSNGTNDLTVSTSATAAVGDLVVVRGTLGTDKDLGAGYHYDIIIEDAAVAAE